MREKETRELVKERWGDFLEFMEGQTMSAYEDGATNFYDEDVYRFIRNYMK